MIELPKSAQRRAALERRRSLSAVARRDMSAAICAAIARMDEVKAAKTVMSYMAFGYEADMSLLNAELLRRGTRLCFPVCADDGVMEARTPEGNDFVSGIFCIMQPDPERSVRIDPREIDAVIVPCAAFDAKLQRIGRGGGYYDRFLPRCGDVFTVAAAFSVQRVDAITAQEHDVPMSAVATEDRIYR